MADLDPADFDAGHIGYLVDRLNEANDTIKRMQAKRQPVAPASASQKLVNETAKGFKAIGDVLKRHEKQLGEAVTKATLKAVAKGAMVALMDVLRPQLEDLRKRLDAIEASREES